MNYTESQWEQASRLAEQSLRSTYPHSLITCTEYRHDGKIVAKIDGDRFEFWMRDLVHGVVKMG